MINEKSKNLIKEGMLSLPKETQEAINSLDWEKISEEIGKKYLLNEEEIDTFQLETASVLLGLVDEDSYPGYIENEVGTSKDEAIKISVEVFQKIFTPIKNIMDENIKKNLAMKNPNSEQTLNFILSGGEYSELIAPTSERSGASTPETSPATPTLADIKDNAESTSQESSVSRMEDIRRKFTI